MAAQLHLYTWDTPNGPSDALSKHQTDATQIEQRVVNWQCCGHAVGKKISIALEEMGLPHTLKPINIGSNVDQFTDEFKAVSPNCKIPAIGAYGRTTWRLGLECCFSITYWSFRCPFVAQCCHVAQWTITQLMASHKRYSNLVRF